MNMLKTIDEINSKFESTLKDRAEKFGEYDACLYQTVVRSSSDVAKFIEKHIIGHSFCEIMEGKPPYSDERVKSEICDAIEIIILNHSLGLLQERDYPELEIFVDRIMQKLGLDSHIGT